MPKNTGSPPDVGRVDARFRNGQVARAINPRRWRWTIDDQAYPQRYEFDIVDWQPVP